jgi:hypothetical protein
MTTTGTTGFNLDVTNLLEEAYERAGGEIRTGYDVRTARRSLNLLTIDWANRGINLWTIEQGQIPLNQGQIAYNFPVDTVDLLDHVVRTQTGINQTDISITRISMPTYATIPNKNTQGRPIQVWVNRQSGTVAATDLTLAVGGIDNAVTTIPLSGVPATLPQVGYINLDSETIQYSGISGNSLTGCLRGQNNTTPAPHVASTKVFLNNLPCINVWPTPSQSNYYTFVYWRLKRIDDAGNGREDQAVPFRFIPCLVAGLAYYIAMKLPEGQARLDRLKQDYEEQWLWAASEDREKAAMRIVPRIALR